MTSTNWCNDQDIKKELKLNNIANNSEDALLLEIESKVNALMDTDLRPYADSLPYADASITDDIRACANTRAMIRWHRRKMHWEDAKNLKEEYKEDWDGVVAKLKAIPSNRLKPVAVSGSFASDSTLLKNVPGMTDAYGNTLSSL